MKSILNALERFKKVKLVKNKTTWILKKTGGIIILLCIIIKFFPL